MLVCVACFFIIAPFLVLYSIGDRFDFQKIKITKTGGIYVRTFPAAEKIIIDSKIIEKPGMFSNSIFVQSLLPDLHTVLAEKSGYYNYFKTIPVAEEQVTKLENVLLFKKNIQFEVAPEITQSPFNTLQKYIIKNNKLYYSNAPENISISAAQKAAPILEDLSAFSVVSNSIIWLGTDGFLYQSGLTNITTTTKIKPTKLTLTPLKINKKDSYKIVSGSQNIFLIDNNNLLFLNTKTNNLDNFYNPVENAKISPDGNNIIYYNDNNIYISPISAPSTAPNLLYKSPAYAEASAGKSEKITDCLWLNNNYIIFVTGPASPSQGGYKIIISETDYRGEINSITFPSTITIPLSKKIEAPSPTPNAIKTQQPSEALSAIVNFKNPQIFFNQQDGKLYILTNGTLLLSEKLIP